ncbi:extended-spectrum class D beta-lactamase OXA-830 [Aeromonas simiae]|uniref:Beta-lactamase n=1 Tax=Aeromonas simiae TaxID=218936 RepID=A0A5J6WZ88_9GAMM|nr:extended-spectrum class D beta-lactamase OXA-830 [Aeromonas simiae]QCQ81089.1 class D beta-lactamase OXA-830 [Aeromonas simiae]QFI56382.1 class D beta-lactamase [Aeromonas simiae]
MTPILLRGLLAAGLLFALPAAANDGCFLFADGSGKTLSREGACSMRLPPASTFKIPLALMGYDSGYLVDEQRPALPFKPGYNGWLPAWHETTTPSRWMTYSVVWFSQLMTEWLGMPRLQHYVDQFDYGNRDLSGHPGKQDGLTQAWLSSSLQISPEEQARFLGRMLEGKLPVAASTLQHTANLLKVSEIDGWQIHGKTGMGYPKKLDGSLNRQRQIGWFVGWASKGSERRIFVHTVIQPPGKQFASLKAKEEVLAALPAKLAEQAN